MLIAFSLAAVGGYLLGSVPFGLLLTRWAGLGDIRDVGSGNIGATNVLRTGRKDLALATLLLDAGKAGAALLIARGRARGRPAADAVGLMAGAAALVGHCYPVWLGFKGGKGVATFFGVLFAGVWPLGMLAAITWLAVATMFRYSSLAALAAAAVTPVACLVGGFRPAESLFTLALAALVFWRHRSNIARLRAGEEPRIGERREQADAAPAEPAPPPASAPVALAEPPTSEP